MHYLISRFTTFKTKLWLCCDNCGELFVGVEGERHGEDHDGWACDGIGRLT